MKILWLANFPKGEKGGSHPVPWTKVLTQHLKNYPDVELTILTGSGNIDDEIEVSEEEALKVIRVKTPTWWIDMLTLQSYRIKKIRAHLKKIYRDYDLIHIHGTEHQYHVAARNLKIPMVLSIQGILIEYVKCLPIREVRLLLSWSIGSFYEKNYLQSIDHFICRTWWDKKAVNKLNSKAIIHHNWEMIRHSFFQDNFSTKKENVLFMGGCFVLKGFQEMIQAFDLVKKELDIKLIILGGFDISFIHKAVHKYRLENLNVSDFDIRGFQDENGIVRAFKDSYCLVHPTHIDNSPNTVCEAQVSGLPVIASDVGGVSSLIEDRKTGLLTSLDPKQIAEKIIELHHNDGLWHHISKESRKVARERHNYKTILENTISIYETVNNHK